MNGEKSKSMLPVRFWQEVYIAAVRAGQSQDQAKQMAQQALNDYYKLTGEKSAG